jgi:hypothetical protein
MSQVQGNLDSDRDPLFLVDASCRLGQSLADQAIHHLENIGILPDAKHRRKKPVAVPLGLLMDLGAILRLRSWQEGGLDHFPGDEVPALLAALDRSETTLASEPQAFADLEGLPPLADRIFTVWETYFAWSGLEELNADVRVDLAAADEGEMLEDLADLLWRYRHAGSPQIRS